LPAVNPNTAIGYKTGATRQPKLNTKPPPIARNITSGPAEALKNVKKMEQPKMPTNMGAQAKVGQQQPGATAPAAAKF